MGKSACRFFIFIVIATFIYWMWSNCASRNQQIMTEDYEIMYQRLQFEYEKKQANGMKYVLIWTLPNTDPLMYLGQGQDRFIKRNCKNAKCFISTDRSLFDSITHFDVVVFSIKEIVEKKVTDLPIIRSPHQKYVFASSESSDYYPLCDDRFDTYFNVTWTYKLNSDISYGYIVVRNNEGEVIGPKEVMHWKAISDMDSINDTLKIKLKSKRLAAAWFVSNCNAPSDRDTFVKKLRNELKKFNMDVDIYGSCGTKKCPRQSMASCLQSVERDYYFYLSFENSFSEDYVTEKLLHGLQHYAVPIVYGAANYSRFMPDGIYLNARELGPQKLAERMHEIINDKEQYYNFFRWHKYYSFHQTEEDPETDIYCKFCEKMNDIEYMRKSTVLEHVRKWWNPKNVRTKVCPIRWTG
ncbi:hypothetical protein K1T71_007346 [Dendrolimus kikuchii]|uniref:Uncharacterized protein n=1 Tax=Dendrolimus kikuchii TaxID=765133 RepID=A0ACC1D1S9_9NEOP|nr:hypothetical protein K1T71_007346 [Dendrolimus kikuchii]